MHKLIEEFLGKTKISSAWTTAPSIALFSIIKSIYSGTACFTSFRRTPILTYKWQLRPYKY